MEPLEPRRVAVYSSKDVLLGHIRMACDRIGWPWPCEDGLGQIVVRVVGGNRLILPPELDDRIRVTEDETLLDLRNAIDV